MKNLFNDMPESEKSRILEMHKKATKNQYLNEQDSPFPDLGDIFKTAGEMVGVAGDIFVNLANKVIETLSPEEIKPCFESNRASFPKECATDPTSESCKQKVKDEIKRNQELAKCLKEKAESPTKY